jgi:hypothetical protein
MNNNEKCISMNVLLPSFDVFELQNDRHILKHKYKLKVN